ncbi:MAG: cupin-like domain-containing protein, partial [Pirellulales bacterium]
VEGIVIPPPALKKQADATTDEWVDRYLRLKGRPPVTRAAAQAVPPAPAGIPESWKRWIGENKLLKTSDEAIVDVLVKNGFARAEAAAEVERAAANPYLQAGDWYVQRLKKLHSLLGIYRELAKLRPSGEGLQRRSGVSRQEFLQDYYIANRPVVLEGLMDDWPAMRRWTPDYLKTLLGDEEVEIMAGRADDPNYEINCQQHRRTVRFHEYVDMVHSGAQTNDYYLVANNGFLKRPKPKQLLADVVMFEEYLDPRLVDGGVFFWYGPAGTVTPLHHDTSNIFMAQVRGRKRIRLISPNDVEFLYNDIGVFSPVDCDAADLARWPQFRKAEVREVLLEPGEVLFIPVGWWHHVRALDVSITVSFTNFAFANHYEWSMPQIRK